MGIFYYALCILCIHFTIVKCIGLRNDFVQKERSLRSLEHDRTPVCDCGPNGKKCKIVEGEKVCECAYKYKQIDGFCKPYCENRYHCENDASCVNGTCQCLPGTRGKFCKTVNDCKGIKGALKCGDPGKINCLYDSQIQKGVCSCRTYNYLYDENRRKCIECDCNRNYGTCSLVDGVKTCKCNPGTAIRKERGGYIYSDDYECAPCDCGNNSISCSFQDISGYGIHLTQVCDCKEGYYENQGSKKCEKCECEPHGKCKSRGYYLSCDCDDGYKPFVTKDRSNITCKECDCGGNGVCSFKEEVKYCKCDKLFAERKGKCVACQCYANDKIVDCYFEGKIQHCLCPEGYENGTFFCKDIDECLNGTDVCPRNTYCVNTMGSFECPCVEGYEPQEKGGDPKVHGCVGLIN